MTHPDPADLTTITFEPFTAQHLPGALALSRALNWPHRLEDWALSLSVSQGVAAIAGGRVIGTALCSLHGLVGGGTAMALAPAPPLPAALNAATRLCDRAWQQRLVVRAFAQSVLGYAPALCFPGSALYQLRYMGRTHRQYPGRRAGE